MTKIDLRNKLLVSSLYYDIEKDNRLLIPFIAGTKIGFANKKGEIVISPQYQFVLDDFYTEFSLVRVGETYAKSYERKSNTPKTYLYNRFGLIKPNGDFVVPMEYENITMPIFCNKFVCVLRSLNKGYAVINSDGDFVIPFGKYDYIDGFDRGFARVKIGKVTNGQLNSNSKWGIINELGEYVLEPKYKNIWNFYDKSREYTNVVSFDGIVSEFHFTDGKLKNIGCHARKISELESELGNYESLNNYREQTYDEYNGSYAQDVMGYSDQDIEETFDGDPEAYWNID